MKEKNKPTDQHKDAPVKPEEETLHTTDPQENMEGPVSSLVNKAGEGFDSEKTRAEADRDKEENM